MKTALIFGSTGQDGSYLAEILLQSGYQVVGVARRCSSDNTQRLAHLLGHPAFLLVPGDITDASSVIRILNHFGPEEVYNLAAQSFVKASFDEPVHTTDVTYLGCLNILEGLRSLGLLHTRVYQASSSEMFGSACSWLDEQGSRQDSLSVPVGLPDHVELFQDELTPFAPNSPYAVAKLAAHHLCRIYRESYGLFVSCGILFNHESKRRSHHFVTRKITRYIGELARARMCGQYHPPLMLGNMEARRDWGHARDYCKGMHLMLQKDRPGDYVLATGQTHSVLEFFQKALRISGLASDEQARLYYEVDPELYRPCEVRYLRGKPERARRELGWTPDTSFHDLVREMVESDGGLIRSQPEVSDR